MDEQNIPQDGMQQQDGAPEAAAQEVLSAGQPASGEPAAGAGNAGEAAGTEQVVPPQAEAQLGAGAEQPQQPQQQAYQLPPGYVMDPATGQVYFTGQVPQQPVYPSYTQPGVVYVQPQPTPEQVAAQQAEAQQRYGQVVSSVEQFLEGDATVSDVVKTLYTTTSQDDQLWKGIIVGAAAAVLLTSDPVRKSMGKTIGALFPGLKDNKTSGGAGSSEAADAVTKSEIKDKE